MKMKKLVFPGLIVVLAIALMDFVWAMAKDPSGTDFVAMILLGLAGVFWFKVREPTDFYPVIRGGLGWFVSSLAATILLAFIVGILTSSLIPALTKLGLAATFILVGAAMIDIYLCLVREDGINGILYLWRRQRL